MEDIPIAIANLIYFCYEKNNFMKYYVMSFSFL